MRRIDWNGSTKTIAATTAQTLIWSGSDLPGSRVVAYLLAMSGTTNILTDIDRIRVKARGASIYDMTTAQLRFFTQATSPSNLLQAGTELGLIIPFFDGTRLEEEEQDQSQFPEGETPQVEVVMNTGSAAGTAVMGWILTDQDARYYPRLLSQAHNIAASATNGRMAFSTTGVFRGLSTPITGLNRLKIQAGLVRGRDVEDVQLANVAGVGWGTGAADMALDSTRWKSGAANTADPAWHLFKTGGMAAPGRSYIEADTGAGWSATGEVCVFEQVGQ